MKHIVATLATTLAALTCSLAQAAPFSISRDIVGPTPANSGNHYVGANTGANDSRGAVSDGGFDAFDGWFLYTSTLGGLTLNRDVSALQNINTYRWLDTFTNNTNARISTTVRLYGNYGSDGNENFVASSNFMRVSRDSYSYDPMIGAVWGNNAWAASNMAFSYRPNDFFLDINLSLNAGESAGLLLFTQLSRPDDSGNFYNAVTSGTQAAAIAGANNLVNNPYLNGLTQAQQNSIVNFRTATTVPEPASLALVGLALAGVAVTRRKR